MAGHAIFLDFFTHGEPQMLLGPAAVIKINLYNVRFALLMLFVSHGVSYVTNFLEKKEYRKTEITQHMLGPYKRIVVMHLTIIACGALFAVLTGGRPGELATVPVAAVAVLIGIKTAVDLVAHTKEHAQLQKEKV